VDLHGKIKVNINSLSTTEKNILKQTRSLRLYGIASFWNKRQALYFIL
jgi:hypothetical protein